MTRRDERAGASRRSRTISNVLRLGLIVLAMAGYLVALIWIGYAVFSGIQGTVDSGLVALVVAIAAVSASAVLLGAALLRLMR